MTNTDRDRSAETPESITAAAEGSGVFSFPAEDGMKNPCDRECPNRTPECKADCPRRAAFLESLKPLQEERRRERLLSGYQVDALQDNRRRYGWKNGRPKL